MCDLRLAEITPGTWGRAWEDVFTGEETRGVVGFHDEMEKKLKIQ